MILGDKPLIFEVVLLHSLMLTTAILIRLEAGQIEAGGPTVLAKEVRPPRELSTGTLA
jgi:hypothetical protein